MSMRGSFSVEDNKMRLYSTSRLDAETYARVKAAGFRWAPKQELFVAPAWSPAREDLLLELCGEIDDEDYSPEERAADRAERFSGYREKRIAEATAGADRYEAGPSAFGHQNRARAERQAARFDRVRTGAVSQWSKAEYWQQRTEGVIANALYKSSPSVRRGRILTLEAELRAIIARFTPNSEPPTIMEDEGKVKVMVGPKGRGSYFIRLDSLEATKAAYGRAMAHLENRLTYERAMLAAEGGSATEAEMEVGGFITAGRRRQVTAQIHAITRSPVTKKVVSVKVMGLVGYGENERPGLVSYNVQRLGEGAYRAPTAEEKEAFLKATAERKATEKASKPKAPALINPTDEDAERLQAIWNAEAKARHGAHEAYYPYKPTKVLRITQAIYSLNSKGSYARAETVEVLADGTLPKRQYGRTIAGQPIAFKVRKAYGNTGSTSSAYAVIIITDKPQKPLPIEVATPVAEPVLAMAGADLFQGVA